MSDKIAEAWEAVERAAYVYTAYAAAMEREGRPTKPDEKAFRVFQATIRAYGLAVLEEAVSKVTHDNEQGAFECAKCAWGIQDLRERLKAPRGSE